MAPLLVTMTVAASALAAACSQDEGRKAQAPSEPSEPTPPPIPAQTTTSGFRDPGTKTIHRLNRAEYNNTVRDLLGTSLRPADAFPPDDHAYGYDNIADVLPLSPLQIELYKSAATAVVEEALADPTRVAKLIPCNLVDEGCASSALAKLASRAFRRPPATEEVAGLTALIDLAKGEGGDELDGFKLAMRAMLISPSFLFRVEVDSDPRAMTSRPLNGYELASRLSYFLWSSMPDDALLESAANGKLEDPGELRTQALRMLDDPRSRALVENFAGQWLHIRDMTVVAPDGEVFPEFDDTLRTAMQKETELFFAEFLRSDLDLRGLLNADFTFVNARLAEHYGMPAPPSEFAKVKLDTSQRRGLFGQGTYLASTSYPARTSPVKRGKFVLDQLLCEPPPPPPPGVEGLGKGDHEAGTVRERMEKHRKEPVCAACHAVMDPIGFGLENFDGIGRWRTKENGSPIDASGTLPPSGAPFVGGPQLAQILADDARVGRCFAQHLFTYALGRGMNESDAFYLDELAAGTKLGGNRVKDLIVQIVTSEPFRMRRPGGGQ